MCQAVRGQPIGTEARDDGFPGQPGQLSQCGDPQPAERRGKLLLAERGDVERAERIELQARSMDLPADISPRTREGTLFFVDIGLPPGKGAGAIVEKYGEDMVALRDAATCP